ncbi:phosphoribosyltransferase-like protein [Morganella morganii]|uniref:phosphoribosyltransferase-like protein n=1 Tax=Morganella morganii TaxID=582 RepID=UPI002795C14E|nr:hypothetical protein [Morganella morganii]WLV39297.1 hypothetical protein M2O45_20005 [Morganella morganii]
MSESEIKFHKTQRALEWLKQFNEIDRPYASLLLEKLHWVSSYEFETAIRNQLLTISDNSEGRIALFVEREVSNYETVYKFNNEKPRRAFGKAFEQIKNIDESNDIGSEGLLNTIATTFKRSNALKFSYYPSAEKMREEKIRDIVILTDTIGSGDQILSFINCFSKTPSLRSWYSSKHVKFYIICYAATESGLRLIDNHILKPIVIYKKICPTIENSFNDVDKRKIIKLCIDYNPESKIINKSFLGYGGVSSLICYAHGLPNNSPKILFKRSKKWNPLFRNRTAVDFKDELPTGASTLRIDEYMNLLGQKRIVASEKFKKLNSEGKIFILVLSSLSRAPRTVNAIASRSGLSYIQVSDIIVRLRFLDWINDKNRLTDEGHMLLDSLRKKQTKKLSISIKDEYYPNTLRRP